MSRVKNRLGALAAAVLLCLSTAACSANMTAFDATTYVKGLLDETYRGTWDAVYLHLVDLTEAEAQDAYDTGIDQEYQRFCYQFDLRDQYLTDETREEVKDFLQELCAKASYSVKGAVELDDTRYAVEVNVRPMDLFLQVREDDVADFAQEYQQRFANVDLESRTAQGREQFWETYENGWARGVLKLCRDKLGLMNYLEVQPILVLVAPDDDGLYTIGDNDFSNLSALILPY